ncbi:MAG: tRNA preQ1(34) S-adenosylmethionine ribosyltransferase-isomerase QueA [Actinobacteria bacterium]|nr:tRNA preQ1(34) S-adenosylmethionine ribosyltransferase-isomerase QueA [Actinomycetota bacterium]
METSAFDYELPESAIAQHPLAERDAARLLVDQGTEVAPLNRNVRDLAELLEPGDLLVLNTTRVLPARLALCKETGAAVEVLLLERLDGASLSDSGTSRWEALVRPGRKLPPGTVVRPVEGTGLEVVIEDDLGDGRRAVTIDVDGPLLDVLERFGVMPLPPYITEVLAEQERYQTVFAERPASAAAPTAGLHLTSEVLARCTERGIVRADVELVVGLGTFRPIASDQIEDHVMHGEFFRVPQETLDACARTKANGGRVVAVGTTAVRALESAAAFGMTEGRTELFIHGDYEFAIVDRLMTNFHLPKSSLIVMIDAFIGARWRDLYADALRDGYRFLSFGDAMLLTRQ